MNLPKTEQTPDDPKQLPPARRRRAGRLLTPLSSSDQESFLDEVALRVSPSFDTFLFSLIAAITISFGFIIDSPGLLILGVLFVPTMSPIVGLSLGTITGSTRFFGRSLISLLIIFILVLLISIIAGYLLTTLGFSNLIQVYYFSQLIWHNLLVLAVGTVLTVITTVRSKRGFAVASVALSYEIFLPLTVAGLGLGSGIPHLWPDGLVVFAVHLALASLLGAITLIVLGFRPLTMFGYTLGGVALLVFSIILLGLSSVGAAFWGQVAIPTAIPSATSSPTMTPSQTITPSDTSTPIPPTSTLPPSATSSVTPTSTDTPIPSATPVYAIIDALEEYGGGNIRSSPELFNPDTIIQSVLNGTLVEVLSDKPEVAGGYEWLYVRLPDGTEGWMLLSILLAATPAPNW
jgi:hypothetical protein